MKVAIVVGHNKYTGARSVTGVDEWLWNSRIAERTQTFLANAGIDSEIFTRDKSLGYTAAMKKHARDIKQAGCTHGLELHFNYYKAYSSANGFEFLYWWASRKSRHMAQTFARQFQEDFPHIKARGGRWFKGWVKGAKMLWLRSWNKNKADSRRGAEICFYTHCPFIVAEPCFASNLEEWQSMEDQIDAIAMSYTKSFISIKQDK